MSRFWDSFANNVAPGIVAGHSMYLRGQQSNRENVQTQMLQEKLDEMRKERELSREISQIAPYNTVEDVSGQSPAYGEGEYQPQGMVTERQVPKTSYQMFLEKAQMAGQKQSPAMEEHYTKMAQNALKQQAERFELLLKVNPKKAIEFNNNNPDLRGIFGELEQGGLDEKGNELLTSYGPDGKPVALHSIIRGEGGKISTSTHWLNNNDKEPTDVFKTYRAGTPRIEGESDTDYNARIFKGYQQHLIDVAGGKKEAAIKATNDQKNLEGFKSWTPEAKKQAFMFNMITGEPPVSTKGMASGDRQVYAKDYGQWIVDNGFAAQDVALMRTDYKAGDMSLKNMSKQEAPMNAFVLNINKQVDKLGELFKDAERSGLRIMDLPMREIRVRAKGSGKEAVLASYLLEVSNEIGKLSSGASGSVQQLSDSAKEDWKKVHDVNLSPKEIMYVLNATKDQANMRVSTWREAKDVVRQQISGIGGQPQGNSGGTSLKDRAIAELKRRGKL